jgi:hypothetical protein
LFQLRLRRMVPARHPYMGHVLIVLDAWRLGRGFPWRLVIAKDREPEQLDWCLIAGLDATLVWDQRESSVDRLKSAERGILTGLPSALQVFEMFKPVQNSYVLRPRDGKGLM